jgi:hypothetical protein
LGSEQDQMYKVSSKFIAKILSGKFIIANRRGATSPRGKLGKPILYPIISKKRNLKEGELGIWLLLLFGIGIL